MRALSHVIDDAVAAQAARYQHFPWLPTRHAAEQYRARADPTMAIPAAWRILERCLPAAELLPEPTLAGQQRWLLPGGDAVVVCRPDPKIGRRVAVTVLGRNEMIDVEVVGEVVEAYQRIVKPDPPPPPAVVKAAPPVPAAPKRRIRHMPLAPPSAWEEHYRALEDKHYALSAEHMRHVELYVETKRRRAAEAVQLREQIAALSAQLREEKRRPAQPAPDDLAERRIAKANSETDRLRRHAERTDEHALKMKGALRAAVVGLRAAAERGDAGAVHALALVAEIDRGFVADDFCYPDRFTRAERRDAGALREESTATGGLP